MLAPLPQPPAVPGLADVAARQAGVVSRAQVLATGRAEGWVHTQLRARRWTRLHPGVYATFTGPLPWLSRVWAALLACGEGATACRETALALEGLADERAILHVAVPWDRRVEAPAGVQVHRDSRLDTKRHPAASPARTRVEDSVLDVVGAASRPEDVVDVVTRACQRRRTTAARLAEAAGRRQRLRWRQLLIELLADVADGVESPLEHRFAVDVERRHGLPKPTRQHKDRVALGTRWRDGRYEEQNLLVELDGRAAHPGDEAHRDYARDNAATVGHEWSLRYGWRDVTADPCAVAAQVAAVLKDRGWTGRPRRCSPTCPVDDSGP